MKYDNGFYDDRDLIDNLNRGCEIEFLYEEKKYSITHTDDGISIIEFYNDDSEKTYSTAELLLAHDFNGKSLKDIISEIKIIDRSF